MISTPNTSSQTVVENGLEMLSRLKKGNFLPTQKNDPENLASSLSVLLFALNPNLDIVNLCHILPSSKEDFTLIAFVNTLTRMDYTAGSIKIDINKIDHRLFPTLFIPDNTPKYPIVILGYAETENGDKSLNIFNSKTNKIESLNCTEQFSGTAWIFTEQNKSSKQKTTNKNATPWLLSILKRFYGILGQIMFISLILGILSLAIPVFVMVTYDKVIGSYSIETLPLLIIGVIIAVAVEWSLKNIRTRTLTWVAARINYIISTNTFYHLLMLPPLYTENASASAQVSRFRSIESIRSFLNSPLFQTILEIPATLIILTAIAIIGGSIVIIPISIAAAYTILVALMVRPTRNAMKESARLNSDRQQMLVETFEKNTAIRSCGLSSTWLHQIRDTSGKASLTSFHSTMITSWLDTLAQGLFTLSGLITISVGITMVWEESITAGALIAVMILSWKFLAPLQIISTAIPRLEQLRNTLTQINRLFLIEVEHNHKNSSIPLSKIKGEVSLNKVGLRYTKDNDPVFTGLSIAPPAGSVIAITGSNGSGKSSILKLINGMYRPQAGNIRIDGYDIRQITPTLLRRMIGYAPQAPQFFDGTIADNLRMVAPLASKSDMENALLKVDGLTSISMLEKGLNTNILQNSHISTSLLYKINLARVFLQDSPIMLFDELPYAVLNSKTGELFLKFIQENKGKKTIFFVTHRQDYIKIADKVILLDANVRPFIDTAENIIAEIRNRQEKTI